MRKKRVTHFNCTFEESAYIRKQVLRIPNWYAISSGFMKNSGCCFNENSFLALLSVIRRQKKLLASSFFGLD